MSADPIKLHRITNTVRPFSPAMAALAESGRAIIQADRVNPRAEAEMDAAIADLNRIQAQRIKAVKVASALGKPELADEILQALHAHDDCEVGFIVRTS